ncbi:MAG: DedA family protein [Candidatus Tectomicrobia bacterium]|uniref:DedA family protein n=1 Tax=Tectimicrobiota bacterium TaxID=2528274 RepID=A0A937VWV4_UNCTE|nr:DedA family protein [Candidatus Tectomicrobia bacterium]
MLEFLSGYSTQLIYVLLFVLLLLCGLGFPMAEELVLLAGGVLVASDVLDPFLMFLVNLLGVLIGDVFLFGLGRGLNKRLSRSPRFTEWFATRLERGQPFFARYGSTTVFLARFIPGLRAPAFLIAGTLQMSFWRFLTIDTLASLIFVPALCVVGYLFADQVDVIATWFRHAERALLSLLLLVLLAWLWRRHWSKRKSSAPVIPP